MEVSKCRALLETPIYKLNETVNDNIFYIKRDDLIPFSFGGNKARKAALFFDDIEAQRSDCVVTYGSGSSNHCRIVANISASIGMPCYIISPYESEKDTYNTKMMKLFGAHIIKCHVEQVRKTIDEVVVRLNKDGRKPYFIPGGGHGNIGTQAYVEAYKEIYEYEKRNNTKFNYIFHASGTGTTQAGLICGNLIYNGQHKIIGISNARKNPYGGNVVLNSVRDYLESLERETVNIAQVDFVDDYVGDGYGKANSHIIKTIKNILVNDGIPLDSTYTGKAFWGMEEYIKKNNIRNNKILFIHTGGTPLFYDDLRSEI